MTIQIHNADERPIYEQIGAQIKNCIMSGELSPGEALPSIRALAKDLRISVITTKRAYEELDREGFIHTVAGKGCYVAEPNTALLRESNLRQIEAHMREINELSQVCGLTRQELAEIYTMVTKEEARYEGD